MTGTAFSNFQVNIFSCGTWPDWYYPHLSGWVQPDAAHLVDVMPRFLAACFDLDGTLVDTTPQHLAAEAETLQELGVEPTDPRRPWTFGLGDFAGTRLLAETFGLDAAVVFDAYSRRWWEHIANGVVLRPGARELLARLHVMKLPLALVTSVDSAYMRSMFDSCGIGHFFHAAISMENVRRMKPHPEPYLTAAARLGVQSSNCIGFEDSPAGLASLRSAGMYAVSVVAGVSEERADLAVDGLDAVTDKMLRDWFAGQ